MHKARLKFEMYADELHNRPPVSHKVREYLEELIHTHLLVPNKLVVNQKWNIVLGIYFVDDEEEIVILPVNTFADISVKSATVFIPNRKNGSSLNYMEYYVAALLDVVRLFLTRNYKTFHDELMANVTSAINRKHIDSIPFPATFDEQLYVGDTEVIRAKYESGNTP